jgi:hypothetical protein
MSEKTESKNIVDRCPSCGSKTLFIGDGGYLTCSLIGCPEPSVGKAIAQLRTALLATMELAEERREERDRQDLISYCRNGH